MSLLTGLFLIIGNSGVSGGELGFLRHRALVEREGVRRARAVLRRRADVLRQRRRSPAAWQVCIIIFFKYQN